MISNVIFLCVTVAYTLAAPQFKNSSLLIKSLGAGSRNNAEIANAVLSAHNQYREKHGVSALKLDPQLNDHAREWALHLAQTATFKHRSNNPYGENLYWGLFPGTSNLEIAQKGVKAWYDEITLYNFEKESVQSSALHFTQVVWRESQRLGVGVGVGANGGLYLVCNYSPRGNVVGYFKVNVPKPIKS